jgi:hypothetical protein
MVRRDMKPADEAAVVKMGEMAAKSELTIWASTVAREEIDKIPEKYRQAHLNQYNALKKIRASDATWIDTDVTSAGFGTVREHPDFKKLRGVLKDENDARLVFQAKAGGVRDFVTVDYNSVLNKASELEEIDVRALSPSQYLDSRST